jgi:putative transposase
VIAVRPKNTSERHPEHKVYPYLLRGKAINRPSQVCAADIHRHATVAFVPGRDYRLGNPTSAILAAVEHAHGGVLRRGAERSPRLVRQAGTPGNFNTDQGAQFTSDEFTEMLQWSRSRDIHKHKSPVDRWPEIRRTPDQKEQGPRLGG